VQSGVELIPLPCDRLVTPVGHKGHPDDGQPRGDPHLSVPCQYRPFSAPDVWTILFKIQLGVSLSGTALIRH
jgi:hypothetical protein